MAKVVFVVLFEILSKKIVT